MRTFWDEETETEPLTPTAWDATADMARYGSNLEQSEAMNLHTANLLARQVQNEQGDLGSSADRAALWSELGVDQGIDCPDGLACPEAFWDWVATFRY